MASRIALVTGGNKGIGLETVRQLAQQGDTVWLGSRDLARGETAAASLRTQGLDVRAVHLDLADSATFDAVASALDAEFGRLDVLINNAGIALQPFGAPTTGMTREILLETFDVNLFRLIELTHRLLPLLKASPAGRIVNLSSILGSLTMHADPSRPIAAFATPAYDLSKTALNAYTLHLADELRDTTVRVNSAHPGWVKTDLGGSDAPMSAEDGAKTAVALAGPDAPNGTFQHLGKPLPW